MLNIWTGGLRSTRNLIIRGEDPELFAILMVALTTFLPKGTPVIKKSFLAPHVALISDTMAKVVPKQMKQEFKGKLKDLQAIWKAK